MGIYIYLKSKFAAILNDLNWSKIQKWVKPNEKSDIGLLYHQRDIITHREHKSTHRET